MNPPELVYDAVILNELNWVRSHFDPSTRHAFYAIDASTYGSYFLAHLVDDGG